MKGRRGPPAAWIAATLIASGLVAADPMPRIDVPDIPAEQVPVEEGLPLSPVAKVGVEMHGSPGGGVVVLASEGESVTAYRSLDGGITFAAGVSVFGGPGELSARSFASAYSDGTTYVVAAVADPAGGTGLQVRSSPDLGLTWSAATSLVAHGDPYQDVGSLARLTYTIAAGSGGRVGVVFTRDFFGFMYAAVSANSGGTWTSPVRIDAGATNPLAGTYPTPAIAFDAGGVVHVAYTDSREVGGVPSLFALVYTRSFDGGLTFEGERVLATRGREPDLAIGDDGSLLIAACRSSQLIVLRSVDGGGSFATFTSEIASGEAFRVPHIVASPDSGTVVVAAVSVGGNDTDTRFGSLRVLRSTNHGVSFGTPVVMATRAARAVPSLLRTASGTWALAWTDARSDDYVHENSDAFVKTSTSDGASWGPEMRIDGGGAGSAPTVLGRFGIVSSPAGSFVFAYADGRGSSGAMQVWSNRATELPLAVGADARVDALDVEAPVGAYDQDLASDGASSVYVAFPVDSADRYTDVYVAASHDGGRTFGPAVPATPGPLGAALLKSPRILARADGRLYLFYRRIDPTTGAREIRLSRSVDSGATWEPTSAVVGYGAVVGSPTRLGTYPEYDEYQAELIGTDEIAVAWSDRFSIRAARSDDDGASFVDAALAGQVSTGDHYGPALCGHPPNLALAFVATGSVSGVSAVWGSTSSDSGATWSAPVPLQGIAYEASWPIRCAASPGTDVLVTWPDYRDGDPHIFGTIWDGGAWGADRPVLRAPGASFFDHRSTYSGAGEIEVVGGDLYLSRSTDGGTTFSVAERLDLAAPVPEAPAYDPGVASDGAGRVWVTWDDGSASISGSQVVRYSEDHGATFGPVIRLNRDTPQGVRTNVGWYIEFPGALSGGAFVLAMRQERFPGSYAVVVNAHDPSDLDRDGTPASVDCDDVDPTSAREPEAVSGVTASSVAGGVRIAWQSQAAIAGRGTVYDLVDGDLGTLRGGAGFASAECLATGVEGSTFDDVRPPPAADEGVWYLARARNGCGEGTFERTALDAARPCP